MDKNGQEWTKMDKNGQEWSIIMKNNGQESWQELTRMDKKR